MEESYMEGVASRHGPRSCASRSSLTPKGDRVKVRGEVSLTSGESVSWVLSSESIAPRLPVHLLDVIGEMSCPLQREGHGKQAES